MQEIKFESEAINNFFREKTGKTQFTSEDIEKANISQWDDIDFKGEVMSQEDLNLLTSVVPGISILHANCQNLNFPESNMKQLRMSGCNITGCRFDGANIENLSITYSEFSESLISDLAGMSSLEELEISGEIKIDSEKILEDYPNYKSLPNEERYSIISNPKYELPQKIDFSQIGNLSNLTCLSLNAIQMTQEEFDNLAQLKKLRDISLFGVSIDSDVSIPKIDSLRKFEISGQIESMRSMDGLKNIEELLIIQGENKGQIADMDKLREFRHLKSLSLYGVRGSQGNLPNSEHMRKIVLSDCGINDIEELEQYGSIERISLDGNPLANVTEEDMRKFLRGKNINISFKDTCLFDEINSRKITGITPELEKKLKGYFGIEHDRPITQYDLMTHNPGKYATICGNDLLNLILELELDDKLPEKLDISLSGFQDLSEDTLKFLQGDGISSIEFSSLRGVSSEDLQKMRTVYDIKGDLLEEFYDTDTMTQILQALEQIKEQIPPDASEYDKFKTVYRTIGLAANYDHSGCKGSEEYVEGAVELTRSLKGVLLEGRAVCAGYSLALQYALDYVGIETERIGGYAYGDPEKKHSWNQVKIDGKWYNVDLTWDYKNIQRGVPLEYCLVDDAKFYKDHTADAIQEKHECPEAYEQNENSEKQTNEEDIARISSNFGKGILTLFNLQDFKQNAQENMVSPGLVQDIKAVTNNRSKKENEEQR